MIEFSVRDSKVVVNFPGSKAFSDVVLFLKSQHCTFNPDEKDWTISLPKYESIREKLSELDIISISFVNEKKLNELLLTVGKQQEIFPERRSFDQSLLKKSPVKGISPNEDYQKQDIIKGISRNRYLFDLEMGLGKSYILSGVLSHLTKLDDLGKILILTTRSGTYNFYHELLKFTHFLEEDMVIANKDSVDVFESNKRIVITDFDTFRLISDKNYKIKNKKSGVKYRSSPLPIAKWIGDKKACLILDESHCVGNPQSRRYATIKLIADQFYFRYLSTGTFVDKVEKIYSQLNILDPGLVHNYNFTDWLAEYASIGNRFSAYAINYFKKDKIDALMDNIRKTYASHRRVKDHIILPENFMKKIYVRMSDTHREVYEKFIKHEMQQFSDMRMIQNKFQYLMLSLENPKFLESHEEKLPSDVNKAIQRFKVENLEKYVVLDGLIDEHVVENEEKMILWTSHPKTAEILRQKYLKHDPIVINGETEIPAGMTRDEMKRDLVEKFKNNKKNRILIAGIQVLNTSVTVTEATCQVYVERTFDYITFSQSMARIHRIGQTRNVSTYVLLYSGSLDVYMDKNLETKGMLNEKLLSKDTLSTEEWKSIFKADEEDEYSFITN